MLYIFREQYRREEEGEVTLGERCPWGASAAAWMSLECSCCQHNSIKKYSLQDICDWRPLPELDSGPYQEDFKQYSVLLFFWLLLWPWSRKALPTYMLNLDISAFRIVKIYFCYMIPNLWHSYSSIKQKNIWSEKTLQEGGVLSQIRPRVAQSGLPCVALYSGGRIVSAA